MSSWFFPWKPIRSFLFALILMGMLTGSAAASDSPALFAKSGFNKYWASFKDYWSNVYRSQGAVTMIVLGTGAVSMFIITRGKWRK